MGEVLEAPYIRSGHDVVPGSERYAESGSAKLEIAYTAVCTQYRVV